MLAAIIVGGGSSRRLGFDKLTAPIAGRPVVGHTLAAFENCEAVGEIILVVRKDRILEFRRLLEGRFGKLRDIIAGGSHRQDSVRAGLNALRMSGEQFVAVHDAARPLITPPLIEEVFAAAREHGAAAAAAHVTDTLKRATNERLVKGSVDRHGLYAMQTPQIFSAALLRRAYEKVAATRATITDEVSAVEQLGEPVALVVNQRPNPKLTFESDLRLAEFLFATR